MILNQHILVPRGVSVYCSCSSYHNGGVDIRTHRIWKCCDNTWEKILHLNSTLEEWSWTPVCDKCCSFDQSFLT